MNRIVLTLAIGLSAVAATASAKDAKQSFTDTMDSKRAERWATVDSWIDEAVVEYDSFVLRCAPD